MRIPHRLLLIFVVVSTGAVGADSPRFLTHFIKPFSYSEEGELKGFSVEIIKAMMDITGNQSTLELVPFSRGLYQVQNYVNTALFIVARRPEREETVQWVGPLVSSGVYFYKRKNSDLALHSLEDLRSVPAIGVGRQNADHAYLADQNFQNLYPTNNQLVTLQMLALGRVDVTPMSELVMPDMASQAGIDLAQIERTDIKLYDSVLYLAFSNDVAKEQVEVWQRALDKLKSNGQYQAIKNRFLH